MEPSLARSMDPKPKSDEAVFHCDRPIFELRDILTNKNIEHLYEINTERSWKRSVEHVDRVRRPSGDDGETLTFAKNLERVRLNEAFLLRLVNRPELRQKRRVAVETFFREASPLNRLTWKAISKLNGYRVVVRHRGADVTVTGGSRRTGRVRLANGERAEGAACGTVRPPGVSLSVAPRVGRRLESRVVDLLKHSRDAEGTVDRPWAVFACAAVKGRVPGDGDVVTFDLPFKKDRTPVPVPVSDTPGPTVVVSRLPEGIACERWCMVHELYRCFCGGRSTSGLRYAHSAGTDGERGREVRRKSEKENSDLTDGSAPGRPGRTNRVSSLRDLDGYVLVRSLAPDTPHRSVMISAEDLTAQRVLNRVSVRLTETAPHREIVTFDGGGCVRIEEAGGAADRKISGDVHLCLERRGDHFEVVDRVFGEGSTRRPGAVAALKRLTDALRPGTAAAAAPPRRGWFVVLVEDGPSDVRVPSRGLSVGRAAILASVARARRLRRATRVPSTGETSGDGFGAYVVPDVDAGLVFLGPYEEYGDPDVRTHPPGRGIWLTGEHARVVRRLEEASEGDRRQ